MLGAGGLLSAEGGHYEERPQQLQMARAVADAFVANKPAVIEAGTGTGKTLAYLVPALFSGRKVVVSTATKALQEQLVDKDLPRLQRLGQLQQRRNRERARHRPHRSRRGLARRQRRRVDAHGGQSSRRVAAAAGGT